MKTLTIPNIVPAQAIKTVNIILAAAALVWAAGLGWLMISGETLVWGKSPAQRAGGAQKQAIGATEKKDWNVYSAILSREKVFAAQMGLPQPPPSTAPVVVQPNLELSQLQLQGVVSGSQGLQGIIANTASDQTYYCHTGDTVGTFKVKSIETNKVVLEQNGQLFELRL